MIYRIAAFACLGGFLFGYDLGLISGALLIIKKEMGLSSEEAELIVSGAKFGAFFGTFIGGAIMHKYGRRMAILASSVVFTIGPLMMAFSSSWTGLTAGRVVVGLGIGSSSVAVPAYLAEMASPENRGTVVSMYEVMLCVGMLMSSLIDFCLKDVPGNWHWMVGAPAIPGLILGMGVLTLPESPRWLITQDRMDDAVACLETLRYSMLREEDADSAKKRTCCEVEEELMTVWSQVQKEKEAQRDVRRERRRRAKEDASKNDAGAPSEHMPVAQGDGEESSIGIKPDDETRIRSRTTSFSTRNRAESVVVPGKCGVVSEMLEGIQELWQGKERMAFKLALCLAFFNQVPADLLRCVSSRTSTDS